MKKAERFKFKKGGHIVVCGDSREPLIIGVVTGRNREFGRNVYDFDDSFGNPRWCYEENICECRH